MVDTSTINELLEQFSPSEARNEADYHGYEAFFRSSDRALERRAEELKFLVDDIIKRSKNTSSWLDVGCGSGNLLSVLNSRDIASYGIEMDDDLAFKALSVSPTVFCGSALVILERFVEIGIKFDVVTCLHLIEHLDWNDANHLLELMRKVSSDHGLVVVVTPNTKDIDVVAGSFYRDPTHLRQYPIELLEFMFYRTSMNVILSHTFNRFYDEETIANEKSKFMRAGQLIDRAQNLIARSKDLINKAKIDD